MNVSVSGYPFPANIHLDGRHLEDVFSVTFFCLQTRLEDVFARCYLEHGKDILTRSLQDIFGRRLEEV